MRGGRGIIMIVEALRYWVRLCMIVYYTTDQIKELHKRLMNSNSVLSLTSNK